MTSLRRLLDEGRLRELAPSAREIGELFRVVDRDLADARIKALSADRRFATAYNAALQLATIVVRAEGYRTAGAGHHHTTIIVLPLLAGAEMQPIADYLDACRAKRNFVDYDGIGIAGERDVEELLAESEQLRMAVMTWLRERHPELVGD